MYKKIIQDIRTKLISKKQDMDTINNIKAIMSDIYGEDFRFELYDLIDKYQEKVGLIKLIRKGKIIKKIITEKGKKVFARAVQLKQLCRLTLKLPQKYKESFMMG